MLIVCISASNIKHARENSTSLKACMLIKDMINSKIDNNANVEIIQLVDYELNPCIGCGKCFNQETCIYDNDFNNIYNVIILNFMLWFYTNKENILLHNPSNTQPVG